jgi:hypothetical protein
LESGRLTGRGRNSSAKATNTTSAITAGTSQIVGQSWITGRQRPAAASAAAQAGLGRVQRSTTAPDTKAPTK